jgi:HD-like signal output (HDOD) protein
MKAFSLKETNRFLPFDLGPTARDTLQEFIDIDVSADDLVRILNRNQMYRTLFFRYTSKKAPETAESDPKKKEADSPTHRLVSLLGMIGSRNLILALRLHRAATGTFPIAADGTVDIKAADYLKTAIEMEELFLRNNLEYAETAYAAAVYFDWFMKVQSKSDTFKKLEPYYRDVAKRGQRVGLIAYLLAHELPGFAPKYAMAAGILTQAGKLFLGTDYHEGKEAYSEFEKALEADNRLTACSRALIEREKFGFSQEEIGSHILRYFDVFKSLIPAVRYYREPYCLKGYDKQNYTFALLLGLADRMASTWKIPADDKDPVFMEWSNPATASLKLRREKLMEVMKRVMALK